MNGADGWVWKPICPDHVMFWIERSVPFVRIM